MIGVVVAIRLSSQYYVWVVSVERDDGSEGKGGTVSVIEGALSFRSYILPLLFFNSPPRLTMEKRERRPIPCALVAPTAHTHTLHTRCNGCTLTIPLP